MAQNRVKVNVTVDDSAVEKMLDRVMNRLSGVNLAAFLAGPVHEYFAQEIRWNFEGEASPFGQRWEPLHDATQTIREALGYGPTTPINKRTGELEDVLTNNFDVFPGSNEAVMVMPGSAGSATAAISEKIKTMQQGKAGNALGFGPTEPRPAMGLTLFNAEQVLESLNVWLLHDIASNF